METLTEAFRRIGLDAKVISTLTKSNKKAAIVAEAIREAGASNGCDKSKGNLIYNIAMTVPESSKQYRPILLNWVMEGKMKTNLQVTEAVKFLKQLPNRDTLDLPRFEAFCGIGIEVSDTEIQEAVSNVIEKHRSQLVEERYSFPISKLLYSLKDGRMKWADGRKVKDVFDREIVALLGEETEEDRVCIDSNDYIQKLKHSKQTDKNSSIADGFVEARYLETSKNNPDLIAQHQKRTGGIIRCRFPPEPNGYLHIGHAKSMYLNFKGAFDRLGQKGETILRFDDTNPTTEKLEFIENILEDVHWLGWNPVKVTFGSDYFDQLYEYALQLIKKGKAYVDHQTAEEIKRSREIAMALSKKENIDDALPESPWRNRSIDENLREFEKMRRGEYKEGEATLRMKIDMRSPNPCMWDPVAYRIKHISHPHIGDKWCIYPSYDFQHCLVDSLEDIDYSLCTQEFEIRRESYYWLVDQLNLWRAYVWEFGRLNITHTLMSKRKLKELVDMDIVHGWDDPRMPTIKGLRRRGFTPAAINAFCADISVSRTTTTTIDWSKLERFLRFDLDKTSHRAFAVLHPVKLTLINKKANEVTWLNAPCIPGNPTAGVRKLPYQREVYIDRSDVKLKDEPKFLGLSPGRIVSLRYADTVRCDEVVCDGNEVKEVKATVLNEAEAKEAVKHLDRKLGSIHWLAGMHPGETPRCGEVRLYDHLFTEKDPLRLKNWKDGLNTSSEVVIPNAMMEATLFGRPVEDHVQFERLGYFVVDKDTTTLGRMVYNRSCSLRSCCVCSEHIFFEP